MTEIQSDVYAVACSKAESYFDLEAMKRRFGTPPLFGYSMERFNEFMLSLASGIEIGDSITAVSLYQYGLEQFKKIALFRWRSESLVHRRVLSLRENETEAKKAARKGRAPLTTDLLELCKDREGTMATLTDDILGRANSYFKSADQEIRLAATLEHTLDIYMKIDQFIAACDRRANDALRRIQARSLVVAKKLDQKFWEMACEMQYTQKIPAKGE
jgi:hypothetical protein